jgi:hypothetical protein
VPAARPLGAKSWAVSAAAVSVIVALSAPTADADTVVRHDPADARGPLDVRRLEHGHGHHKRVLTHTVVTSGRWDESDLRNKNSYIYFWFSTDGDRFAEARVAVISQDHELTAQFQDYEESGDSASVGPPTAIRFKRPNDRSIKVFFSRRRLGFDSYGWSVETLYRKAASRHCRFGQPLCRDRAPRGTGRGRIRHSLT